MHYPHSKEEVDVFIESQVSQALEQVQKEFKRRQFKVSVNRLGEGVELRVDHHDELNFVYQVMSQRTTPPSFMPDTMVTEQDYYQAEVFLREGGQAYDVMDWTQEDLIQDVIDQYERHLHFLSVIRSPE